MKLLLLSLCLFVSNHRAITNLDSSFQPPIPGLFTDESILDIRLSGDLKPLLSDRGPNATYHSISFSYYDSDSNIVTCPLTAKTRGHFRKTEGNCLYPPILLNFSGKQVPGKSLFSGHNKLKLVMPCQGDEYVVREWLVYKLYNLITEKSLLARLVRVDLDDSHKKKQTKPFYGILLEDDASMASRNHMHLYNRMNLRKEQIEIKSFLKMTVFEYLIGNTDWSIEYLQNIKLIAKDSLSVPYAVPYDFDHSGLVNAPYALPAEELLLRSVRDRRYRGFCIGDMTEFKDAFSLFNKLKGPIYQLYSNSNLLAPRYIKSTIEWLDEFYDTINNEKRAKADFTYPCDKNGTGNVIIKGLKD